MTQELSCGLTRCCFDEKQILYIRDSRASGAAALSTKGHLRCRYSPPGCTDWFKQRWISNQHALFWSVHEEGIRVALMLAGWVFCSWLIGPSRPVQTKVYSLCRSFSLVIFIKCWLFLCENTKKISGAVIASHDRGNELTGLTLHTLLRNSEYCQLREPGACMCVCVFMCVCLNPFIPFKCSKLNEIYQKLTESFYTSVRWGLI